jgi:hypothetical protein
MFLISINIAMPFNYKYRLHKRQYMLKNRWLIDLSAFEWNFDVDMPGQKFHHSLKEHHKISNISKFRCEML